MKSALIIVDIQHDFIDGSLALSKCPAGEDGLLVIPVINDILQKNHFDTIVFTRDYHPPNQVSFGEWPVHCVQGTKGVEYHPELNRSPQNCENILEIRKGSNIKVDSYSAFWDNEHREESELRMKLKQRSIETVYICGLAFDFCVFHTAMDSVQSEFKTFIVEDACRSVNLQTSTEMIEKRSKLNEAGVKLIQSKDIPLYLSINKDN